MTGIIFENMPFETNEIFLYAVSALGLLIIIQALLIWRLNKRIRNLLGNKKAPDLEAAILDNQRRLKELENFQSKTFKDLEEKERRIRRSIQSIKTIRFNPFKGTGSGGNQSFSSALLNEIGEGVVLTSLYSRERVSVYAKPLHDFKAEFELTEEEKEALEKAKQSINQ